MRAAVSAPGTYQADGSCDLAVRRGGDSCSGSAAMRSSSIGPTFGFSLALRGGEVAGAVYRAARCRPRRILLFAHPLIAWSRCGMAAPRGTDQERAKAPCRQAFRGLLSCSFTRSASGGPVPAVHSRSGVPHAVTALEVVTAQGTPRPSPGPAPGGQIVEPVTLLLLGVVLGMVLALRSSGRGPMPPSRRLE